MLIKHIRQSSLFTVETVEKSTSDDQNIHRIVAKNDVSEEIHLIDVFDEIAWPIPYSFEQIQRNLDLNLLVPLPPNQDPFANLRRQSIHFTENDLRLRDEAWEAVQLMLEMSPNNELLNQISRTEIFKEVAKTLHVTTKSLRKYIRKYWRQGMHKNALLGKTSTCGGKGKPRVYTQKNGRWNKKEKKEGHVITQPLTMEDQLKILSSIKKHYLKPTKISLTDAYDLTMLEHYSERIYDADKKLIDIEPYPPERRPTEHQFRYLYKKFRDPVQEKILREGRRAYHLKYRAILKDSIRFAPGPLSVGQIDPTLANMYLVSRLNRANGAGRPTLYLLQDVFSRLIVGFILTFGHASWHVGAGTFVNMFTNKEKLCRKFGVNYNPHEWPHVPGDMFQKIVADNGEFESINADYLTSVLNATLTNTMPHRPDDKGIVERALWAVEQECFKYLPGYVPHDHQRGDPDYRLQACLTLPELTKILIEYIIYYNNSRWMPRYPLSDAMLADGVEPYPADIWRWGMENITGTPEFHEPAEVCQNILPVVEGSVTGKGFYLEGLYYGNDNEFERNLFSTARIDGREKRNMVLDPFDASEISVELEKDQPMISYPLMPRTGNDFYTGWDWGEVVIEQDRQDVQFLDSETKRMKGRLFNIATRLEVVNQAKMETKAASKGKTKSSRVSNISENRKLEHEAEKLNADFSSPTPIKGEQSTTDQPARPYDPPADYTEQLDRNYRKHEGSE